MITYIYSETHSNRYDKHNNKVTTVYIYNIRNDHSGDNDRYHENNIMIIMNLMISTVIITTIIITTRMLRMIVIDNQEKHNINR